MHPKSSIFGLTACLCVLIYFVGCSVAITRNKVIGNYKVRYRYGTELLRLSADGKYSQVFVLDSTKAETRNTGTWEYKGGGEPQIILHNPLIVDDDFGKLSPTYSEPGRGMWILHPHSFLGKISLPVNEDLGLYFEKQT